MPRTRIMGVRLPEEDHRRLERLVERYKTHDLKRAWIAREAMRIGMTALEQRGLAALEPESPKKSRTK